MGSWSRQSSKWLDQPDEWVEMRGPLKERGELLIKAWIKHSLEEPGPLHLQIGVGYATDAETEEYEGAMIMVTLNEEKGIVFSVPEIKQVVKFLRDFYCHSDCPLASDEEHHGDLEGFLSAIEQGIEEAQVFEKGAIRH
jgi:hypothetical protein